MLLRFEIIGVNSQSKKNRDKTTISKQNRGKNAGAPKGNELEERKIYDYP